jgi:hypothetical protein
MALFSLKQPVMPMSGLAVSVEDHSAVHLHVHPSEAKIPWHGMREYISAAFNSPLLALWIFGYGMYPAPLKFFLFLVCVSYPG